METINIRLAAFEGPLDLLYHLIEKNEIDIYDIPIAALTEQYLAYLDAAEDRDMDGMSEFLLMAATLLDIKCRMLLPRGVNEEGEEEDPRAELVERLLQYKMYKYASYELKDRQLDASRMIFKDPSIPKEIAEYQEEVDVGELLSDVTLSRLQSIFRDIMKKQVDKIDPIRSKFGNIEKEKISLTDRMLHIEEYAMLHGSFTFRGMLEEQHSKLMLIVTFLGILELMKVGKLKIEQENTFDDIQITYVPGVKDVEVVPSSGV